MTHYPQHLPHFLLLLTLALAACATQAPTPTPTAAPLPTTVPTFPIPTAVSALPTPRPLTHSPHHPHTHHPHPLPITHSPHHPLTHHPHPLPITHSPNHPLTHSPTHPHPLPFGHVTEIGRSAGDLPLVAHQFGAGPDVILLIAGIHGGYEWNTILLAYELIDYLHENPDVIPPNVTLFVIPSANPDGQLLVTGTADRFTPADVAANTVPGRFNANGVDLNRNWPCNWTPQGTWRDQPVSGGSAELSEPENHALFNFIIRQQPVATVFYHSALNAIFTAGCPDTFPPSRELADVYATAASYPVYEQFTSYAVTGDAGDWMARVGYAAFTVELSTHQSLDWTRNLEGILALLAHFS